MTAYEAPPPSRFLIAGLKKGGLIDAEYLVRVGYAFKWPAMPWLQRSQATSETVSIPNLVHFAVFSRNPSLCSVQ